MNLTSEQINAIKKHTNKFLKYMRSKEHENDRQARSERVNYYKTVLPNKLSELSELDIEELVTNLWASEIWGNKQYRAQKIISENGIPKIQLELTKLLDTSKPPSTRYQRALKELNEMGPASITEMLSYIQPKECGMWNRRAREALIILGIDNYVNPTKYNINSEEYKKFNEILQAIANILISETPLTETDIDMLIVDFFLYAVQQDEKDGIPETKPGDFDHDEIRDLIINIGSMLGFETEREYKISHGSKVDAVWRAKIGNLGVVNYVFEVQKSGSRKSLLLNLLKAKSNPTVQKLIVVSDPEQLLLVEKECEGLQLEFMRDLAYWEVNEVQKVADNLRSAVELIDKLDLMKTL